jgi:uncharacterized protein YbjT (DUF2867 family)
MILVTGATGTTGSLLVRQLSAAGISFRIMARDRAKAVRAAGEGVEIVEGDFSQPDSLGRALEEVERVYLVSSPNEHGAELEKNMIAACARSGGTKHVVKVSVIGADPNSQFTLLRQHGQIEKYLEDSGLMFTHLRPNSFMQNTLMFTPTIQAQGAFYAPAGEGRVSFIDARDIASVAAVALTETGHENKAYNLTGPEALSYTDVASKISNMTGREVIYVDVPAEAAREGMMQAGLSAWLTDALIEVYGSWRTGAGAEVTDDISRVTKRPAHTFDDFLRNYSGAFTS